MFIHYETRIISPICKMSTFFEDLSFLSPRSHLKKKSQHRCFPVNIVMFLRTPILKNLCEWLLLNFVPKPNPNNPAVYFEK